ncbi:MAG: hypothetical protein AABY10_02540, partial [Nanoarchaeota archaeon]
GVDAAAMTRGRGFVPWTSEERQYVLSLFDPNKRNYSEIIEKVNSQFHNSLNVRSQKTIYDMLRYESRRRYKDN